MAYIYVDKTGSRIFQTNDMTTDFIDFISFHFISL